MTELENLNLSELKKLCRQNNISGYSTLKKSEIIEQLQKCDINALPDDIELDEDQVKLLDLPMNNNLTLVVAGAGAGKTTTLSHTIKYTIENTDIPLNELRIVVISYNTAVEKHLNSTLKNLDIKISSKKSDYNLPGVRVLTFHKLACAILKTIAYFNFNENNYKQCIRNAIINLYKTPKIDFLFIDEAHDIKDELISFAESLYLHSNSTTLAGDPRQEINEGASWFTSLWNDSSIDAVKHTLRYNHRSCQRIVRLLNNYSEQAFKGSHASQICTSGKKGRVKFICTEDLSQAIYEQVVKYPDSLIVSPVSVTRYGLKEVFENVNQQIYYSEFDKRIRAIEASDKYLPNDSSQIFAASSLKIKGLEKRTVIVIKPELDYLTFGGVEERIAKRRLYVALSRARRNLIIIYSPKIENPYFSYLPLPSTTESIVYTKIERNLQRNLQRIYNIKDCINILKDLLPLKKFESQRVVKLSIQEPSMHKNILLQLLTAKTLNLIPQVYYKFKENPHFRTDHSPGFHNETLNLKSGEAFNLPSGNELTRIYLFMRALETGRWCYTEAQEFENILNEFKSDINAYSKFLPFKLSQYQISKMTECICLRSLPFKGTHVHLNSLYTFYDIDENIVEIKYLKHSPDHIYECLIKACQSQKKVILYNAYEGKKYEILPTDILIPHFWNLQVPEQILRASHYIRFAKTENKFKRVKIPSLQGKILVTYDVETYNCFPKRGCTLLEVGGIAIYPSGSIISLHYDKGEAINYEGFEQFIGGVGITYENEEIAKSSSEWLYLASQEWAQQFQNKEISLKWAAQESDYLIIGAQPESEIDVMKIYTEWRKLNNIERNRLDGYRSLSDCAFDIFNGIIPFRAHNAYEDALMTLICFVAMIEIEGID